MASNVVCLLSCSPAKWLVNNSKLGWIIRRKQALGVHTCSQQTNSNPLHSSGPSIQNNFDPAGWKVIIRFTGRIISATAQGLKGYYDEKDKGTSILLTATPREDFNAETVITAMVDAFMVNGLPEVITFDRDPRFIGSWSAKDFPAPFMRFLMCLGIRVHVCPPKRPDKNAFVMV